MTTTAKDLLAPLTASKLPVVYAKGSLRFKQIKCDSALASQLVDLEGGGGADFVFFDENTSATGATLTIDDESTNAVLPIGPLRGFRDYPCKRVYITCTAQSGKVLNLWYGKGTFLYGAQPAGKGQWYDRNPVSRAATYVGNGVAPHATTSRFTYTVPANKKFFLEFAAISIFRATAAGAVSKIEAYIQQTTIASTSALAPYISMLDNAVGAKNQTNNPCAMTLFATESFQGYTFDGSTGGTVDYFVGYKGTEFDA